MNLIHIIGGGLAGSEAAWQGARAGVPVVHEMRPVRSTEAHVGAGLAELVCSNSFRSDHAIEPAHRRVLQVDYAVGTLRGGLQWLGI